MPNQQPDPNQNPNAPILLQQFSGLRNTVSAERLGPDELLVAQNIDIDDVKHVHRRRGKTLANATAHHSLFNSMNGDVYGVRDGVFGRILPDYSMEAIATVGSSRVSRVEVGVNMFWSNRDESGKINTITREASQWGTLDAGGLWLSPVLQPSDTLGAIAGRLLKNPPKADYLAYFNGRIYLAKDNIIWATMLYQYDIIDATRTYMMFEAPITGLGVVSSGMYVGTAEGCFFLSGEFGKMNKITVVPDPVIPGSMIQARLDDFPDRPPRVNMAVLFLTPQGLCVGYDTGIYKNLTGDKFWFPNSVSAAAVNRTQNGISQYIGVLDSGGTPASGARIGDYVDAEIRRFQGE